MTIGCPAGAYRNGVLQQVLHLVHQFLVGPCRWKTGGTGGASGVSPAIPERGLGPPGEQRLQGDRSKVQAQTPGFQP